MTRVQLVRNQLLDITRNVNDAHAGLLIQRSLPIWEDGDKKEKTGTIKNITGVQASPLYHQALTRWLLHTHTNEDDYTANFAAVAAQVEGRLMTGLSLGGPLETGATTHHAYGMPMLPGSAVKGAVRHYAEQLYCQRDKEGKPVWNEAADGRCQLQVQEKMRPILDTLFGTDTDAERQDAGYLIWHDAWWLPPLTKDAKFSESQDAKPFTNDVITVHHQKYYADKTGSTAPSGMESPIPNQQLAIQGAFYFVVEGHPEWMNFAKHLLTGMLQHSGMGAKAASGYGYFELNDQLNERLLRHVQGLQAVSQIDHNDPDAELRAAISQLNEAKLIESLSKGANKFFRTHNLDKSIPEHAAKVVSIVLEYHADQVASWDGSTGNKAKALSFINKHRQ